MNIDGFSLGLLGTNCYIFSDDDKNAVVIDPSAEAQFLLDHIESNDLKVVAILLTHAHYDHIQALPALEEELGVPVYLHENDLVVYNSEDNCYPPFIPFLEERPKTTNVFPSLPESFNFKCFDTPGHSPGSVSFYHEGEKLVFGGDVLFNGSIGRTDLPGGDFSTLERSIKNKLYALPDETTVYSGHGDPTTIGKEKASNPFIKA